MSHVGTYRMSGPQTDMERNFKGKHLKPGAASSLSSVYGLRTEQLYVSAWKLFAKHTGMTANTV